MTDISPELLEKINQTIDEELTSNKILKDLLRKIRDGTATYEDADRFAVEIGEILSKAFGKHITTSILPDGRMYWNIGKAVIEPTMLRGNEILAEYCKRVQSLMNQAEGIGFEPVVPGVNQSRIDGILNRLDHAESYDDVHFLLDDSAYMQNFLESAVNDFVVQNADLMYNSGFNPKIIRIYHGGKDHCDYCANLAGTYDYPCSREIYVRHRDCHCTVMYKVGEFSQDAHTKNIYQDGRRMKAIDLMSANQSKLTPKQARLVEKGISQEQNREFKQTKARLIREEMERTGANHRTASIRVTRRNNNR